MEFTVFGARGFIGSHLAASLQARRMSCWTPERGEDVGNRPLGNVIYCIGVTSDFRHRPFDTVRAHVCSLLRLLESARFDSFLYLSSTRLYNGLEHSNEDATLRVNPANGDELYNVSKLLGESMCLSSGRPNVRIARLSNVYGPDFSSTNFLSSILRDAVDRKEVSLSASLTSEKDYVDINDVVRLLPEIASSGRHSIYNVASGFNTRHGELLMVLNRLTGCTIEVAEGAAAASFPTISVKRVQEEFAFNPSSSILVRLPSLVSQYDLQRRSQQK